MIDKKQNEIIDIIKNLDEVKKITVLKKKLNNNNNYKKLLKEAEKENADIIGIRKKLFDIDDFKEYMKLSMDIKLLFIKINSVITSLVDKNTCKNYLNK